MRSLGHWWKIEEDANGSRHSTLKDQKTQYCLNVYII